MLKRLSKHVPTYIPIFTAVFGWYSNNTLVSLTPLRSDINSITLHLKVLIISRRQRNKILYNPCLPINKRFNYACDICFISFSLKNRPRYEYVWTCLGCMAYIHSLKQSGSSEQASCSQGSKSLPVCRCWAIQVCAVNRFSSCKLLCVLSIM